METYNHSPVELQLPSFRSAVVGCMDEGIHVGDGLIYFGTGGTGVVRLEGGDEKRFPKDSRLLTARVAPIAFRALNIISDNIGLSINYTSHHGCGWAAAQGIMTEDEVVHETKEIATALSQDQGGLKIDYAGHITPSEYPLGLTETVNACLRRFGDKHCAKGIVLTIGGGITKVEKNTIEEKNGTSFIISADWAASALEELPERDIINYLGLQVKVASGIMDESKPLPIHVHNAKRIPSDLRDRNNVTVLRLLSNLNRISM